MRLHLVLCVSSILITLALRPHHEFETDLSASEQAQGPAREPKKVPDLKSLFDAIYADSHSPMHISTALMMVACAAFMLVSPGSFAWFQETEESKEKIIEDDSEEEEMEVQTVPTGVPTEDKSNKGRKGRWFAKALENIKVEGVLGGLSLQFQDVYTEKVWLQDSLPKNMQRGAFLMVGMAGGLFIQRMCFFLEYNLCGEPFERLKTGEIPKGFEAKEVIPWYADIGFSMCLLVVVAAAFGLTWMGNQPRQELSFSHTGSYWVLMFFLWFAFIATSAPPLKMTCEQQKSVSDFTIDKLPVSNSTNKLCEAIWTTPARRLDCSLQGHTACQIFMLFLLTLPFALPQLYHQPLCLVWLLTYVGATTYYGMEYDKDADSLYKHEEGEDLPLQLCLLLLAFIIGYSRKYYLEKSMRHQFVGQLRQRQAMAPLYFMFKELVPEYVIPRMLNKEVIADPRNTVTVLFVLINNFGEYTREKQDPKSSLKFLNACFDKMDAICAKYGVTKIETVAEEYVACVGVTKAEQEMDHKVLLTKLLKAAAEILALKEVEVDGGQTVAVEFKMGMHTGSIVAGVIGEKLPRFRLFGDTINTSARMMQKGQPGTLQFGEATMKYVNDDYVVDNSTRPNNGVVTMKGKGEVQTWVLKTSSLEAEEAGAREAGKRMSALSQMVLGMAVEDGDDEFDRMMDTQLAQDESEFSAKEEAQFRCWWHAKNGHSFGMRMNFLTFLLSCVTLAEILHMEHLRVQDHTYHGPRTDILPVKGKLRFTLFLLFRFAAFLICMAWSVLANSGSSWISPTIPDFTTLTRRQWQEAERKIRKVQFGLVTSKVLVSILMWLSYNVLILQQRDAKFASLNFLEYMNQQFSLVFMVAFFVIINGQVISFASSLIFVLLAIVFMALEDKTPLYVSYTGRVVFVGVAALGSILAYEGERTSRARFRSKVKVERTESRIEDVLTTLMPKEVLKEWRANPGSHPVHVYQHATVTQSDLCGFTQLSSGRSPFEVVSFMGELFGRFDVLAQEHNIYKVETVGDAYIAGMAQPYLTDQHSAVRVVEFGLAMIKATAKWSERLRQKDEYKDANVRCRVGVHHGECVGGIVGTGMMRYHLFGEFMSIVDILEATSKEGVCQISDACRMQIESEGGFSNSIKFEERKDELKTSKGEIHSTDEVGGTTFLVYPVITEDRVRNLEEDVSELKKKVEDLQLRTSGEQDDL